MINEQPLYGISPAARTTFFLLFLCAAPLFTATGSGTCRAEEKVEKKTFISQTYIDTVIDRAYLDLNNAMTVAGSGVPPSAGI